MLPHAMLFITMFALKSGLLVKRKCASAGIPRRCYPGPISLGEGAISLLQAILGVSSMTLATSLIVPIGVIEFNLIGSVIDPNSMEGFSSTT
jgi:hypothetical protein